MANKNLPRRSLGDAMTPEAKAFLEQGSTPNPKTTQKLPKPAVAPTPNKEPVIQTPAAIGELPPQVEFQYPAAYSGSKPTIQGDMSLNTRVTAEISRALTTAYMQRRLERRSATQREIVEEALTDWLRKQGLLS